MAPHTQIAVSASPTIAYWSLLDHFVETDSHAPGAPNPAEPTALRPIDPKPLVPALLAPGFLTETGVDRNDPLQRKVNKFLDDTVTAYEAWVESEFRKGTNDEIKTAKDRDAMLKVVRSLKEIRFAVVDLSADLMKPKFAGNEAKAPGATLDLATQPTFGASLVKITAMYAAYQLQYDLNTLAKNLKISLAPGDDAAQKKATLFQAAWDSWVKTQKDDPKAAQQDLPKASPKLKVQGRLVKRANGSKIPMTFASWNGVNTWERKHAGAHGQQFEFVDAAPNLENIFDVVPGNPMRVAFKNDKTLHPPNHELKPKKSKKPSDPPPPPIAHPPPRLGEWEGPQGHSFFERMFAMIDASNNITTASCVMDIGYLYIASALMQSGLYSPERGGGLWLSAPYPGLNSAVAWIEQPLPMFEEILNGSPNTTKHFQVVSAVSAAAFMTLLAQNKLVSRHASEEMKFILDKQKPGTATDWKGSDTFSPVKAGLELSVDKAFSKLGLQQDEHDASRTRWSDCAIIERVHQGPEPAKVRTPLRYVIAVVDMPPHQDRMLKILVQGLDQCVQEVNGIRPP